MIKKTLLVLALCAPQWVAAQVAFDRLVVFGTSLSDSGNAFVLRGGTNTPPNYELDPFLVPDVPYARGGHHFSNGATWIEQYARPRGLAASAQPSARGANAGATNYAVGAARAYEDRRNVNLGQQVRSFLDDSGGKAPSDALYIIEFGGNDVRDVLFTQDFNILSEALGSIRGHIGILAERGARNILVWNLPNLGLTPALSALGPDVAGFAHLVTLEWNRNLALIVAGYRAAGLNIALLDVYGKVNEVVADPAAFGLTNVKNACISPTVECTRPDEFLFWDGIHPTAAAHAIVAQQAAATLGR